MMTAITIWTVGAAFLADQWTPQFTRTSSKQTPFILTLCARQVQIFSGFMHLPDRRGKIINVAHVDLNWLGCLRAFCIVFTALFRHWPCRISLCKVFICVAVKQEIGVVTSFQSLAFSVEGWRL